MHNLEELAARFVSAYQQHHHVFTTAESCTGGLISASLTSISGSSAYFDRAFITYSNEAKQEMLQVRADTLATYGAVSLEVAAQMVTGALNNSKATLGVAVTGIAGPTGGTESKPVGTVCIAFKERTWDYALVKCHHFEGNRGQVREQTAAQALLGLLTLSAGQTLDDYTKL